MIDCCSFTLNNNRSINMFKSMFSAKNIKTFIYYSLCFVFGSFLTLSITQIDNSNCVAELLKHENFKYYKISKLGNPALIILIISSPSNLDRRTTIRETWLTLHKDNRNDIKIKHFFVIGSVGQTADTLIHLSSEQSRYNDLLILPIEDKYNTLTNKVLQSFVWLHDQISYGLNFTFVLKCDDDTFVRTDLLKKDVNIFLPWYSKNQKNLQPPDYNQQIFTLNSQTNHKDNKKRHLYWGYFNGNAKIKTQGKWIEKDWILCDTYLPYAQGGGYILSHGLVSYLAKNAEDLKFYNSEDVSVGTWLAPVSNIDRLHDIRFNTEWNSRGCLNLYIISHKISINEMRNMYSNIKDTGNPCIDETLRRKHYLYNWTNVPSKCCTKV